MPWCPKCRQEYTDAVKRCGDCGVDLVEDLASAGVADDVSGPRSVRIVAASAMLAGLESWLGRLGIPFRRIPDGGPEADQGAIEIPEEFADRVEAAIAATAEVERDGDEIRVLGPRADQEPELPSDPAVVNLGADELAADPAGLVPKLLALFVTPAPRPRRRALDQLEELERRGVVKLSDLVLWLAREGYRRPLFGLAATLADEPRPGIAERVAAGLETLPPRGLALALHVLAQLGDVAVAKRVLPLLEHADADVRAEADEVLMSASGIDVQFDAEAEPAVRERAIQQWRDWIARNVRA